MFADQSFVGQFQAEVHLIFAHTDMDGLLVDLLKPIENILDAQETLVAYTLSRRTGASTNIAFFCEWFYQVFVLTSDLRPLAKSNQEYWLKKLKPIYPELGDIHKQIHEDITKSIIPQQLAVLHQKTAELLGDLAIHYDYLKKYLNHRYLNQFFISTMKTNQRLIEAVPTLDTYLEMKSRQGAFLQLCFPCLLGFLHDFNNPESPINSSAIKWDAVEAILQSVACLDQIGDGSELLSFLYGEGLNGNDRIEWMLDDDQSKAIIARKDSEAMELVNQVTKGIYINAKLQLRSLIFPENHKHLIEQLLEYSVRDLKESVF